MLASIVSFLQRDSPIKPFCNKSIQPIHNQEARRPHRTSPSYPVGVGTSHHHLSSSSSFPSTTTSYLLAQVILASVCTRLVVTSPHGGTFYVTHGRS